MTATATVVWCVPSAGRGWTDDDTDRPVTRAAGLRGRGAPDTTMTTTDTTDDVTAELIEERTHDPETVPFTPSLMVSPLEGDDSLDVATATVLVRWVAECPSCESGLCPDPTDGMQSDRDVVFEASKLDGTAPIECDECGALVDCLVEESANPQPWDRRDPDATRAGVHWFPAEGLDWCAWIGIMPAVTVSEVSGGRAVRYRADN